MYSYSGELVLTGQFNKYRAGEVFSVSITELQDQHEIVVRYLMDENITVTDGVANVTRQNLCSEAATPIREVLSTFISDKVSCHNCG